MTLFEVPVIVRPRATESATRRLTRRNAEKLAGGTHPATHRRLFIGTGETCGDCVHANHYGHHNRSYWKCAKHRLGESHSAASDIRKSWPACALYEPRPEVAS